MKKLIFIFLIIIIIGFASAQQNLSREVYVVSYVGDIDGEVSEDWYYFYDKITDFYEENEIKADFSFYSGTIVENLGFENVMKRLYESEKIELIQKGFKGGEDEKMMEKLSQDEQTLIINAGRNYFVKRMGKILGVDKIKIPIVYNQINGRVNNVTRSVLDYLGFVMYLDMFLEKDLSAVYSTDEVDFVQYGVSFTVDGSESADTVFNSVDEIIKQVDEFEDEDLEILEIEGVPIIPIWVHQQDFELENGTNALDEEKWEIYTETLLRLKNETKVTFVTGKEIYALRRGLNISDFEIYVDVPKEVIEDAGNNDKKGSSGSSRGSSGGGGGSYEVRILDNSEKLIDAEENINLNLAKEMIKLNDKIQVSNEAKEDGMGVNISFLIIIGMLVGALVLLSLFLGLRKQE